MPECLNDNHMFYTRPTLYTDQPSTQANTLHRPTLYTDQHSTQANTLHTPTLYTGQHSTQANTLHRIFWKQNRKLWKETATFLPEIVCQ